LIKTAKRDKNPSKYRENVETCAFKTLYFQVVVKKIITVIARLLLLFVFSFHSFALAAPPTIKQSSSGLCHSVESRWYERTKNYTPFKSIDDCLAAGGRLPKGATYNPTAKPKPTANQNKYKRSAFGHGWDDADGDCQNSRAEALIATSTTLVRFATDKRCRVVAGRWISPFTGKVIQNASNIDIDHVVPLAWSWGRGARQWSDDKREKFANDPVNLLPVEASLNRSKGAKGPDDWLPPAGQCGYVALFLRVVKMYQLTPTAGETRWMRSFLDDCRG
jgi:hypothetical protein